jgi:hypothetical protein
MKKLKLFFVIFLMGSLSLNSSAQSPKTVTREIIPVDGINMPCVVEFVSGEFEVSTIVWKNKVQVKVSGLLEGETTGNIYSISQVTNMNGGPFKDGNANNLTSVINATACLDGIPVFKIHILYHYTINANGEWAASVYKAFTDCY